jgi:hypothetical protein
MHTKLNLIEGDDRTARSTAPSPSAASPWGFEFQFRGDPPPFASECDGSEDGFVSLGTVAVLVVAGIAPDVLKRASIRLGRRTG